MTTEKQIEANKKNALLSTGAVTEEGKAVVAKNAVKHGVFVSDLIISSGDGKENEQEYKQLLFNLIESLHPQGQMEHLLVEKIAVDFWRLRRVLRFETGSIRKYLDMVIYDYYNKTGNFGGKVNKTNDQIDEEITKEQECIDWNNAYIKCLKAGKVSFDAPTWSGEVDSDIVDDLYNLIAENKYSILQGQEFKQFEEGELELEDLRAILKRAEYSDKDIAEAIIANLVKQNKGYEKKIYDLEQKKLRNKINEEVSVRMLSLPSGDNAEKVMRYEKSIQKSIFQNLAILKKLQSSL